MNGERIIRGYAQEGKMKKAILISANPRRTFISGGDEGSILAHAVKIEQEGAVFWPLVVPGGSEKSEEFFHDDIKTGYLYDVHEKRITHVCDISWIKRMSKVGIREINQYSLYSKWDKDRIKHFYLVKICAIFALKQTHKPEDLMKCNNGESVKLVRNYCIVKDPGYVHHDKHMTRGEIMSNHIAELLLRRGVKEKDIEELFFYRLMRNAKIIKRQGAFKKAGRLDLLVEEKIHKYVVYELKRGIAKIDALTQVKRYMKACSRERKIPGDSLKGIILAMDAEPELKEAIKKDKSAHVQFKKYCFSIEMM